MWTNTGSDNLRPLLFIKSINQTEQCSSCPSSKQCLLSNSGNEESLVHVRSTQRALEEQVIQVISNS